MDRRDEYRKIYGQLKKELGVEGISTKTLNSIEDCRKAILELFKVVKLDKKEQKIYVNKTKEIADLKKELNKLREDYEDTLDLLSILEGGGNYGNGNRQELKLMVMIVQMHI